MSIVKGSFSQYGFLFYAVYVRLRVHIFITMLSFVGARLVIAVLDTFLCYPESYTPFIYAT